MIVLQLDGNGSISPADIRGVIPVKFNGQVNANILQITRDGGGNVNTTVTDISQIGSGQTLDVICPADTSLNGSFVINSVTPTLLPQGIIEWSQAGAASSQVNSGTVAVPAGPVPIVVLPPPGPNTGLSIAAFTVVGQSSAGPYTWIDEASPDSPYIAGVAQLISSSHGQLWTKRS